MTPRKETEPTKERMKAANEISFLLDAGGDVELEIAKLLARRDEVRDAETRKRALHAFAEFIRTNAIGLITAESVARVADGQALLSQPAAEEGRP